MTLPFWSLTRPDFPISCVVKPTQNKWIQTSNYTYNIRLIFPPTPQPLYWSPGKSYTYRKFWYPDLCSSSLIRIDLFDRFLTKSCEPVTVRPSVFWLFSPVTSSSSKFSPATGPRFVSSDLSLGTDGTTYDECPPYSTPDSLLMTWTVVLPSGHWNCSR